MKKLIKIFTSLFLIFGIVTVHIGIKQLAFFPFTYIHIVFISIAWLILYRSSPRTLWIALPATVILELFSATPFGVTSCALMITFALMTWLLFRVFTNHSLLMVGLTGLMGMLCYRILFSIFMVTVARSTGFEINSSLLVEWLLETSITTLGLVVLYGSTTRFIKRLKPQYIKV